MSLSATAGRAAIPRASCKHRLGRWALATIGMDRVFSLMRLAADAKVAGCRCRRRQGEPDLSETLDVLLRVHGYQVFFCPAFNSDPHPGNILLLPDGRVGLIDFGLCCRMQPEER